MALNTNKPLKIYYSIREVSQMVGVNESTLRFWEKEIPQLRPKVQAVSRIRQYTQEDIDLVKSIYNLVKVRGFKLASAKKMLAANREGIDHTKEVLDSMIALRGQLQELKRQLGKLV